MKLFDLAATSAPVFYRTYSRWVSQFARRETWAEVVVRCYEGFKKVGNLTEKQSVLIADKQLAGVVMPSGRWLWVGGTDWLEKQANHYGAYNCNSTNIDTLESFANVMDLLMQGCGVGVCLERKYTEQLPPIVNFLVVRVLDLPVVKQFLRAEQTEIDFYENNHITITVGDSRQGWTDALYQLLCVAALNLNVDGSYSRDKYIIDLDLSNIRPDGERIEGFGGVSKSAGLGQFFIDIAEILNETVNSGLTPVQCALLVCTIGKIVVAGNVRRSAIIQQFDADNIEAQQLKSGMWKQVGNDWIIDPRLDCMRMANLTRVFHTKPTLKQCVDSVKDQFHSGEGAIQWAGEAVARSNADLLNDEVKKQNFLDAYNLDPLNAKCYLANMMGLQPDIENIKDNNNFELEDRMSRYKLNPCGEILQNNNFCNLSEVHLNQINPLNINDQKQAFQAAGLSVVVLLHHEFNKTVYQTSRELDPIVGVSFTGLFDFFVNAFGSEWLRWWSEDRNPEFVVSDAGWIKIEAVLSVLGVYSEAVQLHMQGHDGTIYSQCEKLYLKMWQITAEQTVRAYCAENNIKCPNRFTTVQPSGTKSLLTGASPGWHPPIAQRYIRRVTFAAHDPVALACIDYGYTVIPSQKDKDENGNLLHDAYDLRCTEWLIEIPTEVPWANIEGACDYDLNQFSAHAQFDFYMTVQQWYTQHNTSATISFRKHEIEELATAIHEAIDTDAGYISIALLARFDANETFPRLPFEPISLDKYNELQEAVLSRRNADGQPVEFGDLLIEHDSRDSMVEAGCAPCDSDKCDVAVQLLL